MWTTAFPTMAYSLQHGHSIWIMLLVHRHSSVWYIFWGKLSVFSHCLAHSILYPLHHIKYQGNYFCKMSTCMAGEDCCITKPVAICTLGWGYSLNNKCKTTYSSAEDYCSDIPYPIRKKSALTVVLRNGTTRKMSQFYFTVEVRDVDGKCRELMSSPIQYMFLKLQSFQRYINAKNRNLTSSYVFFLIS